MRIVDISAQLAHGMMRYPSPYLPEVQLTPVARHEREARSAQVLICGTHVSTHVDAPFHAVPDGITVDQVPLDRWFGPARVVRLTGRDKSSPLDANDFEEVADFAKWEKVIIDTGWAKKMWGTLEYFTEGPYLTRRAANALAALPKLHLLGMDFPNIDAASETVIGTPAPNHRIILGREIILLENLLQLEQVDDTILLSTAPPRLMGGDGCPCRALAMFPLAEVAGYVESHC